MPAKFIVDPGVDYEAAVADLLVQYIQHDLRSSDGEINSWEDLYETCDANEYLIMAAEETFGSLDGPFENEDQMVAFYDEAQRLAAVRLGWREPA